MNPSIIQRFDATSKFAGLPKLTRWFMKPGRHFIGFFQKYILNSLGGVISDRSCLLFTDDKIHVPLPAGLDIYLTGIKTHSSEIRLTRFLLQITRSNHDDFAIDCGAHLGYYTLILSHRFKNVIGFEPSPVISKILVRNTAERDNVTVVKAMLADIDASAPFFVYPVKHSEYNTGESRAIEDGFQDRVQTVIVPSITLDDYCSQHAVIPSLIKIDVEGGELKLLTGGASTIQNHRPLIVIEMRKDKFELLYQPVVELLSNLGYSASRISESGSLTAIEDVRQWITDLKDESDNLVFSNDIS